MIALKNLRLRTFAAADSLFMMETNSQDYAQIERLHAKRMGLELALYYIDEAIRMEESR